MKPIIKLIVLFQSLRGAAPRCLFHFPRKKQSTLQRLAAPMGRGLNRSGPTIYAKHRVLCGPSPPLVSGRRTGGRTRSATRISHSAILRGHYRCRAAVARRKRRGNVFFPPLSGTLIARLRSLDATLTLLPISEDCRVLPISIEICATTASRNVRITKVAAMTRARLVLSGAGRDYSLRRSS